MKLKEISENLMTQKLREISQDTKLFKKPELHKIPLYDASNGTDSGSRATGNTSYTSGIPTKKRHQKFFGVSVSPEEINI
jgi:hypothetical protein